MKIILLTIGQTAAGALKTAIDDYCGRLRHYVDFELRALPDPRGVKNMTQEQRKAAEGKQILEALQPSDVVVLMDERGQEYTSRQFAQRLEQHLASGAKRLVYIIGGPYGFSPDVYARAGRSMIALSRMTLTHDMCRLLMVEQIYRAFTILNNQPYHHD